MPSSWTQADIDTLRQAILDRKGARSITFENQTVVFESIADMLSLLSVMEAGVSVSTGTSRTRYAATSKGV